MFAFFENRGVLLKYFHFCRIFLYTVFFLYVAFYHPSFSQPDDKLKLEQIAVLSSLVPCIEAQVAFLKESLEESQFSNNPIPFPIIRNYDDEEESYPEFWDTLGVNLFSFNNEVLGDIVRTGFLGDTDTLTISLKSLLFCMNQQDSFDLSTVSLGELKRLCSYSEDVYVRLLKCSHMYDLIKWGYIEASHDDVKNLTVELHELLSDFD